MQPRSPPPHLLRSEPSPSDPPPDHHDTGSQPRLHSPGRILITEPATARETSQIPTAFSSDPPAPLLLRVGFWICIVIAVAAVLRRVVALAHPATSGPPQLTALDHLFASHAALTLAHIVPALAFVLVLPFAMLRRFAARAWPERWLFPLGVIVAITAYAMDVNSVVGGWTERSAVLFFNTLFLVSLIRAWYYRARRQQALRRRWLTRAVVVLLGIATTRPVMGVFFATSRITHLTPHQFFGIAFWIGFSVNWIAVELWLHTRARTPQPQSVQPLSAPTPHASR